MNPWTAIAATRDRAGPRLGAGDQGDERALALDLRERGHVVEEQRTFPVYYHGVLVGNLVPDLVVDGMVIADPKVVTAFTDSHLAQMLGYLSISGLELAILLNFKEARLKWRRVVRTAAPVPWRGTGDKRS